jgi:acetyltransferase-like isoleucine patch superfamily enzyme
MSLYQGLSDAYSRALSFAVGGAFAEFGSHTVLKAPIRTSGERRIALGDHVFVGPGSWLQAVGEEGEVALSIGSGTSIAGACVLSAAERVRIGERVLFASNVYVSDHHHAFEDPSRPVIEQGIIPPRPVEICDGAWLGENVVVGPGVRIGRGAVVGANAVVLEDVPDYSVAVGVPARVTRTFAPAGVAEIPS